MKKLLFIALFAIGFTTTMQAQYCIEDSNYDSSSSYGELSLSETICAENFDIFTDLMFGTIYLDNLTALRSYSGTLVQGNTVNGVTYWSTTATKNSGSSGGDYDIEVTIGLTNGEVVSYDICFDI